MSGQRDIYSDSKDSTSNTLTKIKKAFYINDMFVLNICTVPISGIKSYTCGLTHKSPPQKKENIAKMYMIRLVSMTIIWL